MKLNVRNGEFSYQSGKLILSRVTFSMEPGQILSVLGPNGSGKTTLLKCIVGILEFTSGEVVIDGQPHTAKNRGRYFGYVPQLIGVPPAYTVYQMVLLGRSRFFGSFSRPASRDIEATEQGIVQVGIEHLADRPFNTLSGGERQLVLIARALTQESRVLVFDEPTAALDLYHQHRTVELMRRLAHDQGYSVLFSTHTPSHALHISDSTVLIGSTPDACVAGPTAEIITENALQHTFGVETKIMRLVQSDGSTSMGVIPVLQPYAPRNGRNGSYVTVAL